MSWIRSERQLCIATPVSSFVQCQLSFWLVSSLAVAFIIIKVFLRKSHECSGRTDTYGIDHWRVLWRRDRNFSCVGFESTTTEFRSNAPTDWAIRQWVQLALRAKFVQPPQFDSFSLWDFISAFVLVCHHVYFNLNFLEVITWVAEWTDTYDIHHWRILWNSYRRNGWVRFEPTTTEFRSDARTDWPIGSWVKLALRANFVQQLQFPWLFSVRYHFDYCLRQSPLISIEIFLR